MRRKLGIGPGSVLDWSEEAGQVVPRRAGRYTSEDLHRALFPKSSPKPGTLDDLKEGIRRQVKTRYARS